MKRPKSNCPSRPLCVVDVVLQLCLSNKNISITSMAYFSILMLTNSILVIFIPL